VALRRPEHPERVAVVAVVVLIVANLAYFGTKKEVRGTVAPPERPAAVVDLSPQEGGDIIPQASIVVDLRDNFTGQLSIDGHLIPQDQVVITHPNQFDLSFQPTAAHDIHQFAPGPHSAEIEYWPELETYEKAKSGQELYSYRWNFKVG
jgi:hypothetical protein